MAEEAAEADSEQRAQLVEVVLERLNKSTSELKSYECRIEYVFSQPVVFKSRTLRRGLLYYRSGDDGSTCAPGRTGPDPVLSEIRYFKDEHVQHVEPSAASRVIS